MYSSGALVGGVRKKSQEEKKKKNALRGQPKKKPKKRQKTGHEKGAGVFVDFLRGVKKKGKKITKVKKGIGKGFRLLGGVWE